MDVVWSIAEFDKLCALMEIEIAAKHQHTPLHFTEKSGLLSWLGNVDNFRAYSAGGRAKLGAFMQWCLLYDRALYVALLAMPHIPLSVCLSFDGGVTLMRRLRADNDFVQLVAGFVPLDRFKLTPQSEVYAQLPIREVYENVIHHPAFLKNDAKWLELLMLSYLEHYPGDINNVLVFEDCDPNWPRHSHMSLPEHLLKFLSSTETGMLYSYRTNINKVLTLLSDKVLQINCSAELAQQHHQMLQNLACPRFVNLYFNYLLGIKPSFTLAREPQSHFVMFEALKRHPMRTELACTLACYVMDKDVYDGETFLKDVRKEGVDIYHELAAGPYRGFSPLSLAKTLDAKQAKQRFFGKPPSPKNWEKICLEVPEPSGKALNQHERSPYRA